jgi:oligopeptide/dipeptide ABC transporter ATP-binding protein
MAVPEPYVSEDAPEADERPLHPVEPSPGRAPLLEVRDLKVHFKTDDGVVKAVDGISYEMHPNEVLGVVGESGSGKTVSALAIMGLLPRTARIEGQIKFKGQEVLGLTERELRALRGNRIAVVFQDSLAALNPVYTVGGQVAEAITAHHDVGKAELRDQVGDLLDLVGISNPRENAKRYPHEWSGGMRQRAMIAMAIANDPDLLIADEPTTALDVTIQAQVLDVLERVQDRTHSAIMLITHDLGVVAGIADRVMVMYAGRQAELAPVDDLYANARHPYTLGLMASLPTVNRRQMDERLYRVEGQPPSLIYVPSGCPFHPRCFAARRPEPCATERPDMRPIDGAEADHQASCHFAEEMAEVTVEKLRTGAAG